MIKGFLSSCNSYFSLMTLATLFFIMTLNFTVNTLPLTFLSWHKILVTFCLPPSILGQTLLSQLGIWIDSRFCFFVCGLLRTFRREWWWVNFCWSWRLTDRCSTCFASCFWRKEWCWRIWSLLWFVSVCGWDWIWMRGWWWWVWGNFYRTCFSVWDDGWGGDYFFSFWKLIFFSAWFLCQIL